ncbi:MAG: UDP-N-acetylglucosamine 4,6-dehydratase (inverting) [Flammeovirgaceae bacterium]|nr:UDP-N-acetylglucosamine 4,6-dehydratase (inverting) [Flammeovirgaceae bacterium]
MTLKNKNILVVGGTGSFGTAFLKYLLDKHADLKRIFILSRDEQKQYDLSNALNKAHQSKVHFFIGDVRDKDRLMEVMKNIHIVVHAAAMKHVPIAESNPLECYKTNVLGTQNLVEAALFHQVEKVVALSTDKAVMPINAYGASKLYLEKLVVSANTSPKNTSSVFSVVRYANVLGSRGSVVPFFSKIKDSGELPITDLNMTRFSITMQEGIDIVMHALDSSLGGEIFVPKAPSYKITTVAEAIAPECSLREVGIRSGEKLSELMVSRFEASRTVEMPTCYVVLPDSASVDRHVQLPGAKRVPADFEYDSATNLKWLSVDQLKKQIQTLHQGV